MFRVLMVFSAILSVPGPRPERRPATLGAGVRRKGMLTVEYVRGTAAAEDRRREGGEFQGIRTSRLGNNSVRSGGRR